jgi:hypothetical protein
MAAELTKIKDGRLLTSLPVGALFLTLETTLQLDQDSVLLAFIGRYFSIILCMTLK